MKTALFPAFLLIAAGLTAPLFANQDNQQVQIEARFLEANDHFNQDLGVDFNAGRNLDGKVPPPAASGSSETFGDTVQVGTGFNLQPQDPGLAPSPAISIQVQQVQTTVLMPDNNTVALGGLISSTEETKRSKVPLLGDIPLLGRLFHREAAEQEKKNLQILITPKINTPHETE